jgi:hypothetical protein
VAVGNTRTLAASSLTRSRGSGLTADPAHRLIAFRP